MRAIWEDTRKAILDKGNLQIKNLEEEFQYYTIIWDRYQYTFEVRDKNNYNKPGTFRAE